MIAPRPNLSQSTGRNHLTPAVPELPVHSPAASGAAAGTFYLTAAEEERIAAYLARVWVGATGLTEIPAPDRLAGLVNVMFRKGREEIAARDNHLS